MSQLQCFGNANSSITVLLLLPNPAGDPQLQSFPVTTGEEERHVPLYDEPVMTVPDFAVTVTDAPRCAFPYQLPSVGADLKSVAKVPCFILVTHETKKRHVHRRHP
ncbi:hypothetical protein B296_00031614 [Ensete ventricosum]|uniref:Uncharacterized protein n=1 Tax=Ensete ventricosum TaxID=4639 RepID=A0A426YSL6_ENSVE|nr:hypothetical protein B296_00031614 [Ensete ventricosum]